MKIDNITGVCVNYNTPELLTKALESIRKFYDFPIIVIDGSEEPKDYPEVESIKVGHNIGHGLGMDLGIKQSVTQYVLTFDTDIEMEKPCIEEMLNLMREDTYAVGKIYYVDNTYYYNKHKEYFEGNPIAYVVHPSFQIVQRSEYLKYAPYISDGAPTVLSYHDIKRHNKEREVLIDFPVLDYITHSNAGTRDITPVTDYERKDHVCWIDKWKEYIKDNPIA
jgi:GT2 family glycosyltransferase